MTSLVNLVVAAVGFAREVPTRRGRCPAVDLVGGMPELIGGEKMAEAATAKVPSVVAWLVGIVGAVAAALTIGFFSNLQSTANNTAMSVVRIEAQLAAEQVAEANWKMLMNDQMKQLWERLQNHEKRITDNEKSILKLEPHP